MSAKVKMRQDLAHWKALAERLDTERIQYAGLMCAILTKLGGEVTVSKEDVGKVTPSHAVQTMRLTDGAVKMRLIKQEAKRE